MMLQKFLKYGVPVLTVLVIIGIGYFMFHDTSTMNTTNAIGDSQGCNIKHQPSVKKYNKFPSFCIDKNKTYTAVIHTSKGDITLALLPKNAPNTVNNFVFLAKSGYYDNLTFHRGIPGFVIQGGDPNGNGTGDPGYKFNDEINATSLGINQDEINTNKAAGYTYDPSLTTIKITEGVVAMANSGPNTNGSQFFIALADQPTLDGKYTPFATVTSGMDIANAIAALPRDTSNGDLLTQPVVFTSISITEQ